MKEVSAPGSKLVLQMKSRYSDLWYMPTITHTGAGQSHNKYSGSFIMQISENQLDGRGAEWREETI